MGVDQAKRLKELERENSRLKRAELKGIETKAVDYKSIVKRDAYDIPIRPVPH